jgi:predicted TIM-barrel fold metal-dependent hydrolase
MKSMESCGIDKAIIMGLPWQDPGINQDNNYFVGQCAANHPDKFKALYIPHLDNIKQAVSQIEALDKRIFPGIKLICSWQGVQMDEPGLAPLWHTVRARGLVAMVHVDHLHQSLDGDTPYRLLKLARTYPRLKLLATHLGGLSCIYGLLPQLAEEISGITFVTSVSATMEMVKFAAQVNSKNLIFGSDFPFNHCHDQKTPLNRLLELDLPKDDLADISGKTALKLFQWENGL